MADTDVRDLIREANEAIRQSGPKADRRWFLIRTADAVATAFGIVIVPMLVLYGTSHIARWAVSEPLTRPFLFWLIGAYLTLADVAIAFTIYSALREFIRKHRPKD